MSEFWPFLESVIYMIILFTLQFFLVSRKNKYWGLILPGIFFIWSIVSAVHAVFAEAFFGNVWISVLLVFLISNIETLLLFIIYYYRRNGNSVGSVLIAVFLVWAVISCIFGFIQAMLMIDYIQKNDSEPNIGAWYYAPSDQISVEALPITLEDLGVATLPYRYESAIIQDNITVDRGTYIDSQADQIEAPTQVVTLSYDVWMSTQVKALNKKEKQLQKKYGKPMTAHYDYGANSAYWMEDCLLLRFDNCIILFYEESSKELLNNEVCDNFFHNEFMLEAL